MSPAPEPDPGARRAAAFVAVATFAAARDVAEAIEARRRGAHPSEMRPEADLRRDLAAARDRCGRGWRHLARRLFVLAAGESDGVADDVDAALLADVLLTAQRLGRDLHRLHQHLLGLIAAGADVPPETAEHARRLAADVDAIAAADALPGEADLLAIDARWQQVEAGIESFYG